MPYVHEARGASTVVSAHPPGRSSMKFPLVPNTSNETRVSGSVLLFLTVIADSVDEPTATGPTRTTCGTRRGVLLAKAGGLAASATRNARESTTLFMGPSLARYGAVVRNR